MVLFFGTAENVNFPWYGVGLSQKIVTHSSKWYSNEQAPQSTFIRSGSKQFSNVCSSEHIWFEAGATWIAWMPGPLTLFKSNQESEVVVYRTLLADMPPTIDESDSRKNQWDRTHLHEHVRYSGVRGLHVVFQYDKGPVPTYILEIRGKSWIVNQNKLQ